MYDHDQFLVSPGARQEGANVRSWRRAVDKTLVGTLYNSAGSASSLTRW